MQDVLSWTDKELVRVFSVLTETLTAVHFAGDSGPVRREVQREFRQDVVLSWTDKELRESECFLC